MNICETRDSYLVLMKWMYYALLRRPQIQLRQFLLRCDVERAFDGNVFTYSHAVGDAKKERNGVKRNHGTVSAAHTHLTYEEGHPSIRHTLIHIH